MVCVCVCLCAGRNMSPNQCRDTYSVVMCLRLHMCSYFVDISIFAYTHAHSHAEASSL